jgi:hypothetical protein
VWFFLVEARAKGENSIGLIAGSLAEIQCFIPCARLEDALPALDRLLATDGFERLDVSMARRYDGTQAPDLYPSEYFRKEVELALAEGRAGFGAFVISRESASFDGSDGDSAVVH